MKTVEPIPTEELPAPSDDARGTAPLGWVRGVVLEGANRFADTTVVLATLRWSGGAAPAGDFAERLRRSIPQLEPLLHALGPVELRGGLDAARLVAVIAQGLQQKVDCRSELQSSGPGREPGTFIAVNISEYPDVGLLALALATRLVADAWVLADPTAVPIQHFDAFERFAKATLPDSVRRAIARSARSRGIPWERVNRNPDVLRFGTGYLQKRSDLTTTSNTSVVHDWMTSDKPLSNAQQRMMGSPVPRQLTAASADGAVTAAQTIGYPVVVKPWRGNGGRGVSANLLNESQVRNAFDRAIKVVGVDTVAVEEFLPGDDYRLLFIDGEYIASCKRHPPQVIGDGTHTVTELIDAVNQTRNRPDGFWTTLHDYVLDEDSFRLLRASGLTADSVPAAGQKVVLSSAANGGTTSDTTAILHADNIAAAARAMRIAGIDVCGIDFLLPDPARSYKETGGGICEINSNPAPSVHLIADGGRHLEFLDRYVDYLIPKARGRIPLGVLFGAAPGVTAIVSHLLGGKGVAICGNDSIRFDDYVVTDRPPPWPEAARWTVLDPGAHWALLEVSGEQILQRGLFVEWCDVAVLCDSRKPIDQGEAVALRLASTTVVWAQGLATLAAKFARDPHKAIVCARRPDDPALREHLRRNGRAVVGDVGTITLREGETEIAQATCETLREVERDAWVLAAATAWGLDRDPHVITGILRELAARGGE